MNIFIHARIRRISSKLFIVFLLAPLLSGRVSAANFNIETTALTVGASSGSNTVALDVTPSNAAWTAAAVDSWLHVTGANSSGSGSALVLFTYDANPNATARTGTLTIQGNTLTVRQAGTAYVAATKVTTLARSLLSPVGLALDTAGNIYFSDSDNNYLSKWSPSTQQITTLVETGLNRPWGIALDSAGNVYVADYFNNAVKQWSPTTQAVTTVVSGLKGSRGVAVDNNGNLYIADTGNNAIKMWTATTQQVTTLVSTGLSGPYSVAVDGAGNVYIADTNNNAVKLWTASTQQVTTLVSSGLNMPTALAVDNSGNVFIANTQSGTVGKWTAANQTLTTIATGFIYCDGLALDSSGNVYIADGDNHNVQRWTAVSQQLSIAIPRQIITAYAIAIDGSGNVYVTDTNTNQIDTWTASTRQFSTLISLGTSQPGGVAADSAGNLYITDPNNHAILKWSSGTLTTLITGLNAPQCIAVDPAGNLYFSDTPQSLTKWTAATQQITTLVTSGFVDPQGLAADGSGNVYILSLNSAPQKWSASTQQLTTLPSGPWPAQPGGIAVDGSGNVYVTDSSDLLKWTAATQQVSTLVSGFNGLYGVAVDATDNLYLADSLYAPVKKVTFAFVGPASTVESAAAGSDSLLPVIPTTTPQSELVATSDQTWLTLGTLNAGVQPFSFTANTGPLPRTAHITVLGQSLTVTQKSPTPVPATIEKIAGDKQGFVPNSSVGTLFQVQVFDQNGDILPVAGVSFTPVAGSTGASGIFNASPPQPIVTDASGFATAPLFTANANSGTFTVSATAGNASNTFNVLIAPATYLLGNSGTIVGPAAGMDTFALYVSPSNAPRWTSAAVDNWLHLATPYSSGIGSSTLQFTYDANPSTVTRTGTLTIQGQAYTVTQAGSNYVGTTAVTTLAQLQNAFLSGVTVDHFGNVWFTDAKHDSLKRWSAASQQIDLLETTPGFPRNLAVDSANNIYCCGSSYLTMYSSSGLRLNTISTVNTESVAADSMGDVYFLDNTFGDLFEWTAGTQQTATLVTGPMYSEGIALDPGGNVYIADTQNNAVLKWDSISQTLSNLFSTGTSSPAVAADGFGNIYFSVYGSVQKWNAATQQTTVAIGLGAAPNALTFDELHNLYVSNGDTNSVQKITHAFVGPVIVHESAQAGSDALLPVLPTATPLNGIFAPMSDQSWLTIGTVSNGVISFSFTANTGTTSRTANITVLGQNIALTQDGPPNYTWNGGNGTWAVGTGGWDMGNWVDGNNAIIGNGTDTAGTIMVTSTVNPANITFNPPQTGAYTLAVNGAIAAGNPIAISAGAAMRGTGNIGRTIQPSSTGVIWPGSATVGSAVPAGGETLTVAGLDMSGGGTLKIALNASSTSSTQQLAVTGTTCTLGGTLSLGAPAGTSSGNAYTILSSSSNSITGAFAAIKLNGVTVSGSSPVTVQYSANAVTVTLTAGATPVTIDSFSAKAEGLGVALKWHSVSEYLNAGYNVYRRPHPRPVPPEGLVENGGADWTRVNATLIGGLITNADGKTYRLYDWPAPGAYEYRLESVSIHGVRENFRTIAGPIDVDGMGDLSVNVSTIEGVLAGVQNELSGMNARAASATFAPFSTGVARSAVDPTKPVTDVRGSMRASPQEAGAPAVRDLSGGGVASRTLASDGVANVRSTAASSRADLSPALAARWFSSNNAVQARGGMLAAKVQYVQPGVLAIPQASLPAGFDVHRVAVQREGRAMPVLAIENNTLYLYAPGYSDDYTDTDALFLRSTPAATAAGSVTFASGLFSGGKPAMTSTPASVTASYHDVYFDYNTAYRPYTFAPWFSSQYLTDGSDQQFSLSAPFAGSGAASLTVTLWSLTSSAGAANDHALQVLINGQPVGQTQWSGGQKMMELTFQIPAGVLTSGANQIELVTPVLDGVASQVCFVHALTVNYARVLDGSQPVTLTNAGNFAQLFELSNLPSANVWVVDTRFADRAALVPYKAQAQNDGTYRVRFDAAGGGTGQFLVVPYGQENAPTAVRLRTLKPLKATAYLATGPAAFGAGVQPLLMKHAKEGLRGQFVDQEELFDYYNSGRYGPAGIQNAVRSVRPQYLLLVGRTTYDYHNYSGAGVDPLCPAFLVSTTLWSQTTSDSMFGDLGRGYPEVAVGRLPVNNPNELGGAVQHVMGNAGLGTGWRLHAAADRADPAAGDFAAEADAIAQAHPELSWQRNYLGITCQTAPEVTAALTAAANGGADILMYVGHGNAVRLGNEVPRILDNDSVAAWTGYCVFLQSTCTANWMAKDEAGYQSIAIQALTQPQGGISASIASSTYMNSEDATEFMNQLLDNAGTTQRWGNVLLRAQQWAYARGGGLYDDLSRTEQIFGDPAMPIYSKTSKAAPAAATSAGAF